MKFLVVVLCFVICAVALPTDIEDYKKKAEENVQACMTETKIPKETADKIKQGDFSDDSEGAQCFVECFFKRAGFMNEAGEPQADIILTKLANKPEVKDVDSESLKSLVNRCVKETGTNNCQRAFNIYKCYREGLNGIKGKN